MLTIAFCGSEFWIAFERVNREIWHDVARRKSAPASLGSMQPRIPAVRDTFIVSARSPPLGSMINARDCANLAELDRSRVVSRVQLLYSRG